MRLDHNPLRIGQMFADPDRTTRDVLAFLGGKPRGGPAVSPSATCCSHRPRPVQRACWCSPAWAPRRGPAVRRGLARRRRHRRHRPRGAFRVRRLGDRAHRRGDRPDGAAAGRHERRPARCRGPRPSRRRLRQRGLETLLGGGAGRKPPHRAPPPRGPLARRHFAGPDRRDLPPRGQRERRPGRRQPVCRDTRDRRRWLGGPPL